MVYAARAGGSRAPAPERRSRPLRPVGALQPRSPGACVLHLSGAEGLQGRGVAQFRDGCHAFGGEHAAALQLPVLVLLQQHRSHQAGDGGIVGKDAHNPGAAIGFLTVVKPPCGVIAFWLPAPGRRPSRPAQWRRALIAAWGLGTDQELSATRSDPVSRCMLLVGWFSLWSASRLLPWRHCPSL